MLKVENISFSYGNEININNVSFTVPKGTNFAIIGESGCGKSTLLKLIYGLYDINEGYIFWNSIQVLGPKYHLIPGMPFMKYLAQDFDLMPFISVAENVGKYLSNFFPENKQARIEELLEIVEMTNYANTKAKFLSGGQMQRVALAKVLALEPEVLLLDEPFSHIDNFRKNSLRRKLFGYLKDKEITCIFATHDSTDVLSFADGVAIIKAGEIIESGIPKFVYDNPKNKYVASLFSEVNEIKVNGKLKLVYPHQFHVVSYSNLKVEVMQSYFKGSYYLVEGIFENQPIFFESLKELSCSAVVFLEVKEG
jgi:ABC-type Fe3+/spermidine/putrescine transport system ATPase subunit